METYYAGVYWGIRTESLEECVERIKALLEGIARCDPQMCHWFEKAWTRKQALMRPVTPDVAALRQLLLKNKNEDGSFMLGLWSGGGEDDGVDRTISCAVSSPWVGSNSCVMGLPNTGAGAERILRVPVLVQVLTCMASAWDPDDGVAGSAPYRDLAMGLPATPHPGWLMYFSQRRGKVPALPEPATMVPVPGRGTIVIITPERFTVSNPAHVESANRVVAILRQAGLMEPRHRRPT